VDAPRVRGRRLAVRPARERPAARTRMARDDRDEARSGASDGASARLGGGGPAHARPRLVPGPQARRRPGRPHRCCAFHRCPFPARLQHDRPVRPAGDRDRGVGARPPDPDRRAPAPRSRAPPRPGAGTRAADQADDARRSRADPAQPAPARLATHRADSQARSLGRIDGARSRARRHRAVDPQAQRALRRSRRCGAGAARQALAGLGCQQSGERGGRESGAVWLARSPSAPFARTRTAGRRALWGGRRALRALR